MSKKITIGSRPSAKPSAPAKVDDWVESREIDAPEKMKRLTIDVPESLHRRIKTTCASRGTKIADEVRELLIRNYDKA